jgi:hypothetical protein
MAEINTMTSLGTMLNEVQRKIYGQRNEKLSPVEINRLFQVPVTPEFNLVIYRGLQRSAIDPDVTILQAIPRARAKEYLISIALCLRFGADANMYVDAPKIGIIHILGYVYMIFSQDSSSDQNILNTIILMLVAKGSRSALPIYDRKDTIKSSLSVLDWLNDQGFDTILNRVSIGDSSELQRVVDTNSLAILSILLDMTTIMSREYMPGDMQLAIRAFSTSSFDSIPAPTTMIMMDYKSLDDSVLYLNSTAFDKLLKRGQLPSYLLINKILTNMRIYKASNQVIAVQELERMLLSAIAVGTQLDSDQLSIISIMGRDILESVTREYEKPYWMKVCKVTNNTTPDPLKKLAISLNIDPTLSQTVICESIATLSRSDKEALKDAARRRQQIRMAGDLGTMNEFLNDKIPNLVCRNKSLLQHDPLDYNDIDIAYYRDDQGATWCFTSDAFVTILETGMNPYNSTILPNSFKEQLRYQISVLKRLGMSNEIGPSRAPVLFSTAIDSLTTKDMVTERSSEQFLEKFIEIAMNNGISPETIRSLSKERMMAALQSINYQVNLTPLSTSHALITTSRIIDYINKTDPASIPVFFESLNLIS